MGKIKPIKSKLKFSKVLLEKYENQTARGYLIKCSDGEFFVDEDCFKFSDFLYEQIQGRSLSKRSYRYDIGITYVIQKQCCMPMLCFTFVVEKGVRIRS